MRAPTTRRIRKLTAVAGQRHRLRFPHGMRRRERHSDDQRLRQHLGRGVRQDPQRLQQGRGGQVQDRPEPDPERRRQPARAVRAPARRARRRHGRPGHGRHLDRRVRRGRLDPRAHRPEEGRGNRGSAPAAGRHGDLEGQALRHPAQHQRAAALVPQVPGAEPAQDLGRGVADSKKLKSEGKPYVIGITAAQYEGYVVGLQHDPRLARRHSGQRHQHQGHRQRQDGPGARHPAPARHRRPGQQVTVEQPGARGLRADAERRGRVHHELALRPERHERRRQEGRRRPRREQAAGVRARESSREPRWAGSTTRSASTASTRNRPSRRPCACATRSTSSTVP